MFVLAVSDVNALRRAVVAAFPREASGVLLREANDAGAVLSLLMTSHEENTPRSFVIRSHTLRSIGASLRGTGRRMAGCVHSHLFGRAWPSPRDSAGEKSAGELWLIYSLSGQNLRLFEWDGAAFQRQPLRIVQRSPRRQVSSAPSVTKAGCGHGCRDCAGCLDKIASRITSNAAPTAQDKPALP